jgi:hypothetical protein
MRIVTCILLFTLNVLILQAQQKTYFTKNWLFNSGDSIQWAEANYPDAHWTRTDAGIPWQQFGYQNLSYGWYRYHLSFPKSLKNAVRNKGFVKINLGYASEAAQYFFNGRGLGQSGSLPPRFIRADLSRPVEFYISEDEIRWDTINIVSVRVFSRDSITGSGLVKGPVYYYIPSKLE